MKVVSVENVSKKFRLSSQRRASLADGLGALLGRRKRESFWALKDIDLEVEQGETLGIIGHNGAGKSTMLKLLTRIMRPTTGRIRTRGRISSLIEIGAGFHQEMSGRENIYLNGSILGMTRREIDGKLDEIIAFAELEKFIDMPVKRYSSGMYARLGFAVAAHVDPDILIVDEVLSVGDAAFQEKCTARMHAMSQSAATVIFVSHNMGAVNSLCNRVVLLWEGEMRADAPPAEAILRYRELIAQGVAAKKAAPATAETGAGSSRNTPFAITALEPLGESGWQVKSGGRLRLRMFYKARARVIRPRIGLRFTNSLGTIIARANIGDVGQSRDVCGEGYLDVELDHFPLLPDRYYVQAYAFDALGVSAYDEGATGHEITVVQPVEDSQLKPGGHLGYVWMDAKWRWPERDAAEGARCADGGEAGS